jgi:hypothetical protein
MSHGKPHHVADLINTRLLDLKWTQENLENKVADSITRRCGECGDEDYESYIASKEMWAQYGNGTGLLCKTCFAKRLGRPLADADIERKQPTMKEITRRSVRLHLHGQGTWGPDGPITAAVASILSIPLEQLKVAIAEDRAIMVQKHPTQ